MTKILSPTEENTRWGATALRDGKIVATPTATVYGIACDAFNAEALARLRSIRNSPLDKPLTVVIDKQDLDEYAELTDRQRAIIDVLLPSPVSIFVNKKTKYLDHAVTYSEKLCVMWQESEVKALYRNSGTVIAISSANLSGCPPAPNLERTMQYFGDDIDVYLDVDTNLIGAAIRRGVPSAQLDITKEPVELVRSSPYISLESIKGILAEHSLK